MQATYADTIIAEAREGTGLSLGFSRAVDVLAPTGASAASVAGATAQAPVVAFRARRSATNWIGVFDNLFAGADAPLGGTLALVSPALSASGAVLVACEASHAGLLVESEWTFVAEDLS
jgi:hypothetical protein